MGKLYKTLGIGALALGLASPVLAETLEGVPLGVDTFSGRYSDNRVISIVIEVESDDSELKKKGKKIVAHAQDIYQELDYTDAAALVRSEMNDGDDETIKITGNYKGKAFKMDSITVEDYTIKFTRNNGSSYLEDQR